MFISNLIKEEILKNKQCYFPKSFPKIFSWQELERLLNLRPFVNDKRFRFISADLPYFWENQSWLSDVNTYPPSLIQCELNKYHCYLSDSSRANENINAICGELENTFTNSAVDAHIYFNVSDNLNGGFGIHWDYSHNLIVQMEGTTRFLLWDYYADEDEPESSRVVESLPVDPIYDIVLESGDAIFVPAKSYHQAISQTKRLSISFPIHFGEDAKSQDRHWIKL